MTSLGLLNRSAVNTPAYQAGQFTGRYRTGKVIWFFLLLTLSLSTFHGFSQAHIPQSNADNTLYVDDLYHDLALNGTYRDFTIPPGTEGKSLYLFAKGGDGGTISYKKDLTSGKGGQGATVSGYFAIGSGNNEIPVGATLRVIIGAAGGSHQNTGQTYDHCAGGGGGTGVLFLPPDITPANAGPEQWIILMVAGGGGGGYAKWGRKSTDGLPGNNGESGTGDANEIVITGGLGSAVCNDVISQYKGWGGNSGGGVGYQRLTDVCSKFKKALTDNHTHVIGDSGECDSGDPGAGGYGGFQVVAGTGTTQPIGRAGGKGESNPDGGFGFGSGGGGSMKAPGGGGGYSGGGSGDMDNGNVQAGGGGSYINAAYAQRPIKTKHGVIENPTNGAVAYNISDIPASIPLLSVFHAPETVLESGDFALALMQYGELTLFERMNTGFRTVWRSDTATPATSSGTVLEFTDNGDLQLLDKNAQLVWHTNTAGKGNRLVLESTGKLYIVDANDAVVWWVN